MLVRRDNVGRETVSLNQIKDLSVGMNAYDPEDDDDDFDWDDDDDE